MELKEAVEHLKFEIDNKMIRRTIFTNQAIEVVLKELDKKDKVIDLMAKHFYDLDVAARISHTPTIYNFKSVKHAKEWFYEKVEEQE